MNFYPLKVSIKIPFLSGQCYNCWDFDPYFADAMLRFNNAQDNKKTTYCKIFTPAGANSSSHFQRQKMCTTTTMFASCVMCSNILVQITFIKYQRSFWRSGSKYQAIINQTQYSERSSRKKIISRPVLPSTNNAAKPVHEK